MPIEWKAICLILAGALAGIMNSIAGGGTLVTFPALLWAGLPAVSANVTSTVALLWGIATSIWSYRRELATQKKWAWRFAAPSLLGGLIGAVLLLHTSEAKFRGMVPYLILFAAVVFTFQKPLLRLFEIEAHLFERSRHAVGVAIFFQFLVAIYGGYFGAGIGILMLAALGLMGQRDIHNMNSLKVLQAFLINMVACAYFLAEGDIRWAEAGFIAVGAGVGGYAGPNLARRIGPGLVRVVISVIGFSIGLYFLLQQTFG